MQVPNETAFVLVMAFGMTIIGLMGIVAGLVLGSLL